jgi:hypothetical protein
MRRFLALPLVPLALVVGCTQLPTDGAGVSSTPRLGVNGSDNGTACVLNTQLRAKNETTGSTSEAKGHAQIKVRNDGTVEYKVFILNKAEETFVAGHIHRAPPGVAGPVVVPLFTGSTTSARHIRQRGEATVPATFNPFALCQNPEQYYVNYHTTAFPGGAIRGQLGK